MTTKTRYFHGADELVRVFMAPKAQFIELNGVTSKVNWIDAYTRLVGTTADGRKLPVERAIQYKRFASLHDCDARCMGGKPNGTCECSCGGKNHGRGFFTRLQAAA
jgi:hypothetical protein